MRVHEVVRFDAKASSIKFGGGGGGVCAAALLAGVLRHAAVAWAFICTIVDSLR